MQMQTIEKSEQESLLGSFWAMLMECESRADSGVGKDPLLKHMVAQWYEQWNRVTGDCKVPRWVERQQHEDQNRQPERGR